VSLCCFFIIFLIPSYRKMQKLPFLLLLQGNFPGPILFHMLPKLSMTFFVHFILLPVGIHIFISCSLYDSYVTISALTITAEHSFWLSSSSFKFPLNIKHSAKFFLKSTASLSISQQIQPLFQDRIPESPAITHEFESQIALPLSEIICKNFLGMFMPMFYHA
jgi:hypothetical protein